MKDLRADISGIVRTLPLSLRCFVLLWLLLCAALQWQVHAPGILGDMWDMLPGYQRLMADVSVAAVFQELTRQFAGVHVLAIPRLFYWLNFALFGGSGALLKLLSFLLCFVNAVLFLALLCRDTATEKMPGLTALTFLVFFNGLQLLVIDWDFLLQHYLAVFFSLLAFVWYERSRARWGSGFLAVCAVLCCGSGWVTLGVLPLLWFGRGERGKSLLIYTVMALMLTWLLLPDVFLARSEAAISTSVFFWSAPQLLLHYLAYPFSEWPFGWWAGFLPLLLMLDAGYRLWRRRPFVMADFLGLFFLLMGCSIVLGRYRVLPADADLSRYYVYIAPLWLLLVWWGWQRTGAWARALSCMLCLGLLCAGLAAVAAVSDHAVRMRMAAVVALNGNLSHFAGLRLNAVAGRSESLQSQAPYLREHAMDIYRDAPLSLSALPVVATSCELRVQRKAVVSKGQFTDYFFTLGDKQDVPLGLYATDQQLRVVYHGVLVPAVSRMKGWQLRLRDVTLNDWPLLLPAAWLPRDTLLAYTHLSRGTALTDVQWWLITPRGERCAVSFSAAPE